MTLPRSPRAFKRVSWRQKATEYGLDPAVLVRDPVPVEGPPIAGGDRYHDQPACPGTFRITDQEPPVWTVTCDHCRAEASIPARRLDPAVRREGLLAKANLPAVFAGKRFEPDSDNAPVLAQLRRWIDGFDPGRGAASLLPAPALFGRPGVGKSHLLSVACERVIRECDLGAVFYPVQTLLRHLQRFDDDVVRGTAWSRAASCPVLALDDLGSERGTDWQVDQLADLIDLRYRGELPILLATNYAPSDWEVVLDARAVSRLRHMTFPLELRGRDRRQATIGDTSINEEGSQ